MMDLVNLHSPQLARQVVIIVFLILTRRQARSRVRLRLYAGAASDTNGNGSTAGNGVYDIQVTYTPRNGATAHVEIIHLTIVAMADKTLASVDFDYLKQMQCAQSKCLIRR